MNDSYSRLQVGSAVCSINELKAIFPAGSSEHLLMVPRDTVIGTNWPFPSTRIWSPPGSWDDLQFLFDEMSSQSTWQEFETTRKSDELRETCLVHHFHLESHRKNGQRSSYRWFAFRDPFRFGNVWFNLGGTYRSLDILRPLWTSPEWMARIEKLYPWVASKYRIRGNPGIPTPVASPPMVRHIWRREPDCYPVVEVDGFVYICAGGRARKLDLDSHAKHDRWAVHITPHGSFAKFLEADPEMMLHQLRAASETVERMKEKSKSVV